VKLFAAAFVGTAVAWGLKLLLGPIHPIPVAAIVLGGYGVTYFAVTYAFNLSEAGMIINRSLRFLKLRR